MFSEHNLYPEGGFLGRPVPGFVRESEPRPREQRFLLQKPALYLGSDLFSVVESRGHKAVSRRPLQTISSKRVLFSGERLDQSDLDILLVLLARARESGVRPGEAFRMGAAEILKPIRRRTDKQGRAWLKKRLFRLEAGRLMVHDSRFSYATQLISKFLYDHEEHDVVAVMDRELQKAFTTDRLPQLVRERSCLGADSFAKWLHALAWSMEQPFSVSPEGLFRLCGLPVAKRPAFAGALDHALECLGELGCLAAERLPSGSLVLRHVSAQSERGTCRLCG